MRVINSCLRELVITDSIQPQNETASPKIRRVSIAPLMAEAVKRISEETSVSSLFD
jgi:ribose-phosphate pyrophosphokinase